MKRSSDLWTFVRDIRDKGVALARKELNKSYMNIAREIPKDSPDYQRKLAGKPSWRSEDDLLLSLGHDLFLERMREMRKDPELADVLSNYKSSLTFREHKGRIYIIPYLGYLCEGLRKVLEKDDRLEEYGYWNNTDRPEEVSARQWAARKKVWEPMTDSEPWHDMLVLEIVCPNNMYYIDNYFWEMILRGDDPKVVALRDAESTPKEIAARKEERQARKKCIAREKAARDASKQPRGKRHV